MKKVSKSYVGSCVVGQLVEGMLFSKVDKNGYARRAMFEFLGYDREEKKYLCRDCEDISHTILVKGNTACTTDI